MRSKPPAIRRSSSLIRSRMLSSTGWFSIAAWILYYIMVEGPSVLGYGLLRGWDEGYAIPSLGIAIHPSARSSGLGLSLMHFLHAAARRRGAAKVRLRVRNDNARAVELYKRLGYAFESSEENYYVGFKELRDRDV